MESLNESNFLRFTYLLMNVIMTRKYTFSIGDYERLLLLGLKSGFHFLPFEQAHNTIDKICLLRHDIDADLNAALQMAKVENRHGIKATYFLMLRSPVYNLFGRANHRLVEEIIDLGHYVGLHYDEGFYPKSHTGLNDLVRMEADILKCVFGVDIKAISFHQPGLSILNNEASIDDFINTYDQQLFSEIHYISDSNMMWKNETPWEIFSNLLYKRVQLLVHPLWWVGGKNDTTESLWDKAIIDNLNRVMKQIIETERAFGRPRKIRIENE